MSRKDVDYEYGDLGGSKKSPTIVKKGGWLGRIVALLLGVVIGVVASLGGLVGAGYFIVTQSKIKDTANTVGSLAGIEISLSDYLSDEYAEKTVLGLIEGITAAATKISDGTGTLGDLNKISPFVGTFLKEQSGVIDLLASYGIETTAEELMSKYLVKKTQTQNYDDAYLTDFLLLKINEIPFAKLIKTLGFEGSSIITALCYGVEGVDYEIQDGEYVMLGNSKALTVGDFVSTNLDSRIEKLTLDSIMGTPDDEIMLTLFYGASHRYTQTENGVEMNQVFYTHDGTSFLDDNGDKLDLESATALSETENDYLLTFKDGSQQIVKLGEADKYLAYTTDETPKPVLFPKTTIGDLEGEAETLINSITLESALQLNEQSHAILKSIAYGENGEKHTIKDLREQSGDLINSITLASALNVTNDSHAILQSIAYGENGEKRTLKDLTENSETLINEIQLSKIISPDPNDTIVMYLLYGKKDVHYAVGTDDEIISLQKRVALYDGNVYNEYGELIKDATPNGTESYTQGGKTYDLVASASLGTVQVKITSGDTTTKHDATLYYVSQNGENVYYTPTTIGDMQNAEVLSSLTGRLQLKDVMDVGDNTILKHLGEETIDNLPNAINSLTLDDVFGEHFAYRTYNPTTGLYKSYRENGNHQPIDEEGNLVEGVYLVDINNQSVDYDNDGIITREEADKALTGTWKYLLMERKTDGTFTINHHHTITELDGMVSYMSDNVHAATVRELKLDGIIQNLPDDTLNKVIIGEVPTIEMQEIAGTQVPTRVTKEVTIMQNDVAVRVDNLDGDLTDEDHVGDLTVEQLMLYMSAMLGILEN